MELVDGEDLRQRLERGPIPVDEATAIARQVAEAREEAHEKGIVHRDLKPANVKISDDDTVKVLDFGLAKAWAGDTGSGSAPDLSQSPTLAHTGTVAGLILGTAAYMSPEQARGKAVDKSAGIWAFVREAGTGRLGDSSGTEGGGYGIWAVPFSPDRLEVSGEAFPVAPKGHWPTVADDGTLLYAEPQERAVELVRLDPEGRVVGTIGDTEQWCLDPAFSPDGTRLAATNGHTVYVHDLERGTRTQLTFEQRLYRNRAWTPDGKALVHSARRGGYSFEIFRRPADGSGSASVVGAGAYPTVSPDGRRELSPLAKVECGAAASVEEVR